MKNAAKWMMIVGGAILLLGAGSGMLAATLSMATLGESGISDPKILATAIGHTLIFTIVGFSIAGFGLLSLVTGFVIIVSLRVNQKLDTNKNAEQGA